MMEKIQELISTVPKPVIIGVAVLVVAAIAFFLWKKFSSKDSENEVLKGAQSAAQFAQSVQQGLDREDAPMMSTLTPGYAQEVQQGLNDLETEVVGASAPEEQPLMGSEESDDDFENYE
jgi:hypothetical protein